MTTTPELMPILSSGAHDTPKDGACIMEMASYMAGEEWSDQPQCVHTVLSTAARSVNDALGDDARQRLLPLLMRFLDTNTTPYEALEPVLREAHADLAHRHPDIPFPGRGADDEEIAAWLEASDVRGTAASLEVGFYEDAVWGILNVYDRTSRYDDAVRLLTDLLDAADEALGRRTHEDLSSEDLDRLVALTR